MPRRTAALERLIWALIYGGLFVAGIGLWLTDQHLLAGWSTLAAGALAVVAGVLLIGVRARRP